MIKTLYVCDCCKAEFISELNKYIMPVYHQQEYGDMCVKPKELHLCEVCSSELAEEIEQKANIKNNSTVVKFIRRY